MSEKVRVLIANADMSVIHDTVEVPAETPGTATAADILLGKTAWVEGAQLTGTYEEPVVESNPVLYAAGHEFVPFTEFIQQGVLEYGGYVEKHVSSFFMEHTTFGEEGSCYAGFISDPVELVPEFPTLEVQYKVWNDGSGFNVHTFIIAVAQGSLEALTFTPLLQFSANDLEEPVAVDQYIAALPELVGPFRVFVGFFTDIEDSVYAYARVFKVAFSQLSAT